MSPEQAFNIIRAHALSKPGAVEEFPWEHYAWKVGGKLFAIGSEGQSAITVKADPEHQEMLCSLPGVSIASHVGRYGWIRIEGEDEEQIAFALDRIDESYKLVVEKLPKSKRPLTT